MRNRGRNLVFFTIAVMMLLLIASPDGVTAYPIIDDGNGGSSGDNTITNPGFETGSLSYWTDEGGAGSASATTSKKYEGSYSLAMTGVKPSISIIPIPKIHIVSKVLSVPIESTTYIGGAMYVHGNPLYLFTAIGIHISPADVWLVYYVKGGSDEPDWANRILERVGDTKDTWHHFYSRIASDLASEDISYSGQTIDEIELHVESISILTDVVDGYFDDLYIGSTPPSLDIDAPNNNQWISGTYQFNGDAADNRGEGYSTTRYLIDPLDIMLQYYYLFWIPTTGTTDWYVDVDTTTMTDGNHKFYAYARDATGCTVREDITFKVDNTDPSVSISSPSTNTWVKDTVTISGTANDAPSGLASVKWRIDDGGWTTLSDSTPTSWSFNWDTTTVDDGSYTISVMATDLAGNTDTDTILLKVDNSAPSIGTPSITPVYGPDGTTFIISLSSASDGSGCGIDDITAYLTNPDGDPLEVSISLDATTQDYLTGSITLGTSDLEGTYTLDSITATDRLGHSTTITSTLYFVFDKTKPAITLTSHSNHDLLSGEVTLSGGISDTHSGPNLFKIYIDGELVFTDSTPSTSWSYILDTETLKDGYHVFHFYIRDRAGNERKIVRFLLVENSDDPVAPFVPVVNENGQYITSCRAMVGDSQVVLACSIPSSATGEEFQLLLSGLYMSMWSINDMTYVTDTGTTVSFLGYETWDVASHCLRFPVVPENTPSLVGRSLAICLDKMSLTWTLSVSDHSVYQYQQEQITLSAFDANGDVPYGMPETVLLYALQQDTLFLLGSGTMDQSGSVSITYTIGDNPELEPGNFGVFARFSDVLYTVFDVTSSETGLHDTFNFYELASWAFDPSSSSIVHYTATVYDQRLVSIAVHLSDSTGNEDVMIGQSVQVRIIGPNTDELVTIFQALHDDGIYAKFSYNFTETGEYTLEFDFIPSGYFLDITNRIVTVNLVEVRPTHLDFEAPSEIEVGSLVLFEANLTDAWASNFPIADANIIFGYYEGGTWYEIGTSTTDGYGTARFLWNPNDSIWRTLAGNDIEFTAEFLGDITYDPSSSNEIESVSLISTYIDIPIVVPSILNAGESVLVNVTVLDTFGASVSGSVYLQLECPNGTIVPYTLQTDTGQSLTLVDWGDYIFNIEYLGDAKHYSDVMTQTVHVNGAPTLISISATSDTSGAIAEEPVYIHLTLNDLHTNPIDNALLHVSLMWDGQTEYYTVITGQNDTIEFIPTTSGSLMIDCSYTGDSTYESSDFSRSIWVDRRPIDIGISGIPDFAYPYVDPSYVTYELDAVVLDPLTGNPLPDTGVIFCYVLENETVLMTIYNATGYLNLSMVEDYLAWGLYRSIGSGITDSDGLVSIDWQVDTTIEQNFTVFALTLQTDLYQTGISDIKVIEFQKIPTDVTLNAEWTGEGNSIEISSALWDDFNNFLPGMQIRIQAASLLNPTVIIYETNFTTGYSETMLWDAPEFGAYTITAWFSGDDYYASSDVVSDIAVVSWRLLDLDLAVQTTAYPGETILLEANLTDLNGTLESTLLEDILVYFAYFEDGQMHIIGTDLADTENIALCSWTLPEDYGLYKVFAYTKRQTMYDVGVSEFQEVLVRPVATTLDVSVDVSLSCPLNITYTFDVNLTDESGNMLIGEVVTLYLTDNYTHFWGPLDFDAMPTNVTARCGNPHYHLYKLTVIIGVNDTFSWSIPGRMSDRILFAPRAIAVARYEGSSSYLPTITTRKMSCLLIETDVDLLFSDDPLNMQVGVPQEIQVNVTDEYGRVVNRYTLNITIKGPNGYDRTYQLDLRVETVLTWTPEYSGSYTIFAEFFGAEVFAFRDGHHCYINKGRWHHRHRHVTDLVLTRSYAYTGMLVTPAQSSITVDGLPSTIEGGDLIELSLLYSSGLDVPIGGTMINLYYLDSTGTLILIGSGMTDTDGIAHINWSVPALIEVQGYESVHLLAEADSLSYYHVSWTEENILKIWPSPEEEIEPLSESMSYLDPVENVDEVLSYGTIIALISFIGIPVSIISRRKRKMFMLLMAFLLVFCTTSLMYVGMGLESAAHPYDADLIFGMSTSPGGPATEAYSPVPIEDSTESTFQRSQYGSYNYVTAATNLPELSTTEPGYAVGSPNATYVIVPLTQTLDLNFTAFGHYVVSVLDEEKNPVDTVAGYADGMVNVSFRISHPKYEPGKQYSVNTFVTVQRGGITYGDTSWVIMTVSPCTTRVDLFLESDTIQYTGASQEFTMNARLNEMESNTSIDNAEISFYYRHSQVLEWYEIGTAQTNSMGQAVFDWDVSLPKGSYIINATYFGDDLYDGSMTVKMLTVEGSVTRLGPAPYLPMKHWTQYAHTVELSTRLLTYADVALDSKTVDYYIGKGEIEHWIGNGVTDVDGVATLSYMPHVDFGTYDIRVSFEGDENNAPCSYLFEDGLTVLKRSVTVESAIDEVTGAPGDVVELSATFVDDTGTPITSQRAIMEIYDPSRQLWEPLMQSLTDSSGRISLDYTINEVAGSYVYRINLIGDNATERTSFQGVLNVLPDSTELYFIPISVVYGETESIWAHLQDNEGHPMVDESVLYYIEIDSNWVLIGSAQTNVAGWAGLEWIAEYPQGMYNMKVHYPGNGANLASTFENDRNVISKSSSSISLSVPNEVQYTLPADINATLTSSAGKPLIHKEISLSISIEGQGVVETVTLFTDKDGVVFYRYVSPYLGTATVSVEFAGDDFYSSSSMVKEMVVDKISLAISLTVSQIDAHRGDKLYFSGSASFYNPADDTIIPADEGISFVLEHEDGTDWNEDDYFIETQKNGEIYGEWTIPQYGDVSELLQAGDYVFRIVIPITYGFTGESTFPLTLIERTSLFAVSFVDGLATTDYYVEQAVDFRYTLVDEDSDPMDDRLISYVIDDTSSTSTTNMAGQITHTGYSPDSAGGLFTSASYQGSKYFDPAQVDMTGQVFKRGVIISESYLSATYVHREDLVDLTLQVNDSLTDAALIEPVHLRVMLDGEDLTEFTSFSGDDSVSFKLPDNLQSGEHSIKIEIVEGRVYESALDYFDLIGYENTIIKITPPTSVESMKDNEVRLTLTDEDGTPLRNRFVELSIQDSDGTFNAYYLTTDAFGEADHSWNPSFAGEYELQCSFIGETLFLGTEDDSIPVVSIDVKDGAGKSDAGPSPLWILPLLLLLMVDIALEILTFGFVALLIGEARLGDGVVKVHRIAYPWIEIIWVDVKLPIIGTVSVPIPVPVIRSEFELSFESPDMSFEYSSSYGEDTKAQWGGIPLFDAIGPLLDAMEESDSSSTSTTMLSPTLTPHAPLISSESELDADEFDINIQAPSTGESINSQSSVLVEWEVYHPEPTADVESFISLDGGDYDEVEPNNPEGTPYDGGVRYEYSKAYQTLNFREMNSIANSDALENGAHKIEVKATDGVDEVDTKSHFFTFTWLSIFATIVIFLAALGVAAAIEDAAGNIVDLQMAAMPTWMSGIVGGIVGGLICGFNVILVLLLLDVVLAIFGTEALVWDGLGLPIGVYLGILIIIVGITLLVTQGINKAPVSRLGLIKQLMLVGGIISGVFFILQEFVLGPLSLPSWANALIEIVVAGVSALIMGYITAKFLKSVGGYQFVPTKMQKAMFWGAGGLGLALGGLGLILKTMSEWSKVRYFSWYS